MAIWMEIKRTPVKLAGWMLVGAAILPGIGLMNGSRSAGEFLTGVVGGCMIAIVLRAVVVSALSRKTA